MAVPITPPLERFWRFVNKRPDGCWLWTGGTAGSNARYPMFNPTTRSDEKMYAHRWIYEELVGPIPRGLELDHLCRTILCVNPEHLEPVTHAENRRRARLSVCRAGLHDLTKDENCRWDEKGQRRGCKRCWLDRIKERYQKRKAGSLNATVQL